jgi:anti-sigma-K factor RskA
VSARELPHVDLVAYLLGSLEAQESARVERHVESCAACAAEITELRPATRLLERAAPAADLPPDLERRTLEAVARAAAAENGRVPGGSSRFERSQPPGSAAPKRRRLAWRRPALAAGLAVALAAAVFAGSQLSGDEVPGSPELDATLSGGGGQTASAVVHKTGIGRVVDFRTDALPILPTGEYYELWFVGPNDRPGRPNRISAGTFHPDEEGRSNVRLAAAVDPAKYPRLAVTAEPGDGDPTPTRPDILRSPEP